MNYDYQTPPPRREPNKLRRFAGQIGRGILIGGGVLGALGVLGTLANSRFNYAERGIETGSESLHSDNPQKNDAHQDDKSEQITVPPTRKKTAVAAAGSTVERADRLVQEATEYLDAASHFGGAVDAKTPIKENWVRSKDGKLKKQDVYASDDPGSSFLRGVRVSPEGEITVSEEATLSNWKNRKEAASAAGVDKVVDEYHYPQYAHDDYDEPLVQQAKAHLLEEKINQLSALDQGKPWGDFAGKTTSTPQSKSGGQWYNQELKGPFGGDKPGRYETAGMTDATYVQSRLPDQEELSGETASKADTATRMAKGYQRAKKEGLIPD